MRVQLIGAAALARLMGAEDTEAIDLVWLLHGPTDEAVVEASTTLPPYLMAAE